MFQRIAKKIGQILVEANRITLKQLNNALRRQKENGYRLGTNLADLDYINKEEITQYIAKQYTIPCVSLDRYKITKELLNIIPEDISSTYGVVPLELIGDILTAGIVNVPDEKIVEQLEQLTGFKIQVMLVTAGDFNRYIERVSDPSIVNNNKEFYGPEVERYIKTPSYEGRERRRFPRFNEEIRIKYEFRDEYNINSSINISRGGVLIKSKSPVPVNSHLVVKIELPTSHKDVIIMSRVVRAERVPDEDIYRIALNFSSMDARDNRKLAGFINSLKK